MEVLSPADFFVLKAGALGATAYAARRIASRYLQPKSKVPNLPLLSAAGKSRPLTIAPTRSILKQLEQTDKSCFIFYGSQTGTAERFAHRLAREASSAYNLGCVVADLDDYDFVDLPKLSQQHLIIFVLATYGEGEPTDNAIAFRNFISSDLSPVDLSCLRYCAFGLGSSSYTHYNAMVQFLDNGLSARNAQRVGSVGMGDDGKGTLEEDFSLWLETTLPLVASHFNRARIPFVYKPAFQVTESLPEKLPFRDTFLGEPNKNHLYGRVQGPFTAENPFPATVAESQELFTAPDRSCIHLEFDISGTSIRYDTGDHLAVWPVNSNEEIALFLKAFNLASKGAHVVEVDPSDPMTKMPIPSRTTYETIVRHHLDIGGVVGRQDVRRLSEYATSPLLRTRLLELTDDKSRFSSLVTAKQLTISQLLSRMSTNLKIDAVINAPFSLILETIPKLKPRHYSISSSSLTSRKTISITAVVASKEDPENQISFRGVSTGYLSALKADRENTGVSTHTLKLPRQPSQSTPRPLINVRRSKFRPPFDPSMPVIMIGPGTGVAPFRAFVHDRAYQHSQGRRIGKTMLFYGCRSSTEDFLYKQEWEDLLEHEKLGKGVFQMHTAFSREKGRPKQYVQDLIVEDEMAAKIRSLVLEQDARVYVCGDAARMAKDVAKVMGGILSGKDGFEFVQQLKKEGRWCEDVW